MPKYNKFIVTIYFYQQLQFSSYFLPFYQSVMVL